jgi:biotin transport system permease protein
MISLYRPGTSLLHRLPAWLKLTVLAVVLITFSLLPKSALLAGSSLVLALLAFVVGGYSAVDFLRTAWKFRFLTLIIALPQLLLVGLEKGSFNSIVILSGLLIATLVTMTTKTTEIVDLIKRLTRSENFAMLIGLSINSIAVVGSIAAGIVEAGKARGVRPSTVRQLTNLFVVSLKQADDYAEALAARGVIV